MQRPERQKFPTGLFLQSIFSLKCFAFQTIRPVVSRKKRGFSAHFGPGGEIFLTFSAAHVSDVSSETELFCTQKRVYRHDTGNCRTETYSSKTDGTAGRHSCRHFTCRSHDDISRQTSFFFSVGSLRHMGAFFRRRRNSEYSYIHTAATSCHNHAFFHVGIGDSYFFTAAFSRIYRNNILYSIYSWFYKSYHSAFYFRTYSWMFCHVHNTDNDEIYSAQMVDCHTGFFYVQSISRHQYRRISWRILR